MQQQPILPPATPGGAWTIANPPPGTPQTAQEFLALRIRHTNLSDQMSNVMSRRKSLLEQLKSADPGTRQGLIEQIRVLDGPVVELEQELQVMGQALRYVRPELLTATTGPSAQDVLQKVTNDLVPIIAILSVFVFAPFAIAVSRFIWRRATPAPKPIAVADTQVQNRLDQLQQAVDTIAIEVERISEGQRFVTKLISEQERPALGAGAAQPVRASKKTAVAVEPG